SLSRRAGKKRSRRVAIKARAVARVSWAAATACSACQPVTVVPPAVPVPVRVAPANEDVRFSRRNGSRGVCFPSSRSDHGSVAGELRPEALFVLRGAGTLRGAILCVPFAGASAMLWPPGTATHLREDEDALILHAIAWLRSQGAKVIQCLLDPEEMGRAEPL